jgi:hypothetical protein
MAARAVMKDVVVPLQPSRRIGTPMDGEGPDMHTVVCVLLLLLHGTTAQAQPATLTLACKGTTIAGYADAKPEPISMGVILNFTVAQYRASATLA